jgi:hypothetical protein
LAGTAGGRQRVNHRGVGKQDSSPLRRPLVLVAVGVHSGARRAATFPWVEGGSFVVEAAQESRGLTPAPPQQAEKAGIADGAARGTSTLRHAPRLLAW